MNIVDTTPSSESRVFFSQQGLTETKRCSISTFQTTSTPQWCKNPSNATEDICKNCYSRHISNLSKTGSLGKTCSVLSCLTNYTTHWYKNPFDTTKNICRKCYLLHKKHFKNNTDSFENPSKKRKN